MAYLRRPTESLNNKSNNEQPISQLGLHAPLLFPSFPSSYIIVTSLRSSVRCRSAGNHTPPNTAGGVLGDCQ